MQRLSPVFFSTVLFIAGSVPAQLPTLPSGFSSRIVYGDRELTRIFATRGFAVDPRTDEIYLAIGSGICRVEAGGQRVLVDDLGPGQEVGLLMRPPGSLEIFYTSLAGGTVFRRDLETGATQSYRGPRYAFDLVLTDTGEVLVSANPFFTTDPDGGIWQVDANGGPPREVIQLIGPSGPLVMDGSGNLLYATQSSDFPPPPGSSSVLSFSGADLAGALSGGLPLTVADAQVALGNVDGAYDMVFDDVQRLLISDTGGTIHRTRAGLMMLDSVPMAKLPLSSPLQMEFDGRRPDAPFAPYQPAFGGSLYFLDSNFSDLLAVRSLEPQRPTTISSPTAEAGPGPVDLFVQDGGPGQAWIVVNFSPPVPEWTAAQLNGLPLWVALDLTAPTVSFPVPLGADGTAMLRMNHPGSFSATARFQSVMISSDASGLVWGSSEVYTLLLHQ